MSDVKIYARDLEPAAQELIDNISAHAAYANLPIRIMPDAHAGVGIVVGFTCPAGPIINPQHIGADIGCGIEVQMFDRPMDAADFQLFDHRVRQAIPMGRELCKNREFNLKDFCKFVRRELDKAQQASDGLVNNIAFSREEDISAWCQSIKMDEKVFYKSIGTLGSGNHFIELDHDADQDLMGVTVHTGSRNLGQKVCAKWTKKATVTQGFLSGASLQGYLTDMVICQAYAQYNRSVIISKVADIYRKLCKGRPTDRVSSVHNYLDFDDMTMRKGAIRAYEGERMVIPFNMRDGLAICTGKSNAEWNNSAPHGAGRRMSRNKAREVLQMDDFVAAMQGVVSSSVVPTTIDESPMAYKDTQEIIDLIAPTCTVEFFMRPVVNIKDLGL